MRKDGSKILFWEELPSAQASEAQPIFLYEERCRLANDLVQASAKQTAQLFAFRSVPADASPAALLSIDPEEGDIKGMASIAFAMAAGLRLIFTSAPFRLRHISARSQEYHGLLPARARTASMPLPSFPALTAQTRLVLRQAQGDTSRLVEALAQSGEPSPSLEPSVAAGTGVWRMGVALTTLLQSGQESSVESLLQSFSQEEVPADVPEAFALARSIIRPSDWSNRAPVQLAQLAVYSSQVNEHFTRSLGRIVAEMRQIGLADSMIRSLLGQRRVPQWLLKRAFSDNRSPWRRE